FSPDGEWIVYLSYGPGTRGHPLNRDVILRRMRADGSEKADIVSLFGGQGTINVNSWAPDSKRFAFVQFPILRSEESSRPARPADQREGHGKGKEPEASSATSHSTEVCVYGGTASGVMAAVAASREGRKVILVEPSRWLGGMTGGGLSEIDWGRKEAVGGGTLEVLRHGYNNVQYRQLFKDLVGDHGVRVIYEHRLGRTHKEGNSIKTIFLDHAPPDRRGCPPSEPTAVNAIAVNAEVFIDCSYEGDLMAASGVRYAFGRESKATYGESLAGVRPNLWVYDIDPFIRKGDPTSGLLPFIQDRKIGPLGSADTLTMGYCFRYKFDMTGKGWPVPPPEKYDPKEFELFRRAFERGIDIARLRRMRRLGVIEEGTGGLIRGKAGNLNRALLTTTVYGCNEAYPDGGWRVRSSIWKFHQDFFRGLVHFLRTDHSVPADLKRQADRITFKKGSFDETEGWPSQLYVREARRMISSYVLTEKDLEGKTDPPDAVGLASYGVDDWPYATYVHNGKVALSGGEFSMLRLNQNGSGIYKIPYRAITPRSTQCNNLLVPVCCSASHIAMTSIRMEPVWMILGESSGVAASLAVELGVPVQSVPYQKLRDRLLELRQVLDAKHANMGSKRD
ncbi:MAG: FAD-dependent oxidoreductase, partial [Pirellulales bacterium]|nr:FAD-dependent oxidoreductase [Pirellulales bacterium]